MVEKIAFVTYETPFAPCGGIAAVVGRLPAYVQKASGLDTIVITPYHYKIRKTSSIKMDLIGDVSVPFDGNEITVSIHRHDDKNKQSWYFLLPEDKRFFAGIRHPYDVGQTQDEISGNLLRDALFFGAAAARALDVIAPGARLILMMQDWETATLALALANRGHEHSLFLTLHNSYDSGGVSGEKLRIAGIDPDRCGGPPGSSQASILERALPLIMGPVFTVSDQFALDFTEDIFQARVMANHLQETLKPRLVGINNGLFADLAVPNDVLAKSEQGNFEALREWKAARKVEALEALDAFAPTKGTPIWGDLSKFKRGDAAWFIMAGRDDTRQKGYDVAVSAINSFLDQGGDARFLFFPIPGDEDLAGLNFLKDLADKFPANVLALPFLFKAGYFAALQGATYGVMPSLYEPFGMANEFYLNGTVGIGRATGGILQQIVPLRSVSSFSQAVQVRADAWHGISAHPTGILYREKDSIPSAVDDWKAINAVAYAKPENNKNRVQERAECHLFHEMAAELLLGITNGIDLYQNRPQLYYKMLTEGIDFIQRSFSWERAAREYVRNIVT